MKDKYKPLLIAVFAIFIYLFFFRKNKTINDKTQNKQENIDTAAKLKNDVKLGNTETISENKGNSGLSVGESSFDKSTTEPESKENSGWSVGESSIAKSTNEPEEFNTLADIDVYSPENITVGGYTENNIFLGFDYTGYDPSGQKCKIVGTMIAPFYNTFFGYEIHRYVPEHEEFEVIAAKSNERWEVKDSNGTVGYIPNYILKLV